MGGTPGPSGRAARNLGSRRPLAFGLACVLAILATLMFVGVLGVVFVAFVVMGLSAVRFDFKLLTNWGVFVLLVLLGVLVVWMIGVFFILRWSWRTLSAEK